MQANTLRLSWALRLLAAAILGQTLWFKFSGAPESVYIFSTMGMEPWGRWGSGLAEGLAAGLLLAPSTVAWGAGLALGVMLGALGSHLTRLGIEVQGDGGLLFGLACTVTAASAVLLGLHREQLRPLRRFVPGAGLFLILVWTATSALQAAPLADLDDGALTQVARSAEAVQPLALGASAPDGTVRDLQDKPLRLHTLMEGHPSVLIFYRGGWCPYCNSQMGQLVALEPRLKELGIPILAVSPDKPARMAESVQAFKLNYTLLSDSRLDLARAYGLAFKLSAWQVARLGLTGVSLPGFSGESHHWLPVPAAFVIDAKGKVVFRYSNPDHTVRVDPEALYNAAKAALPSAP